MGGASEFLRGLGEGTIWLFAVLALFLASTVVFDTVHYLLHVFARSRFTLLRRVGMLHDAHHRFLDRNLELQHEYLRKNIYLHVIPEFVTQIAFSLVLLTVVPARIVIPAMGIQLLVFLLILRTRGIDINHKPIEVLHAYRPMYFCVPEYHALHHVYPDSYFSSWIKTLDHLLGTGAELRGRRIALTGASTPFGAALRELLEQRSGREVRVLEPSDSKGPEDRDSIADSLEDADILVLTHTPEKEGAAEVQRDSYPALIERFREIAATRKVPIEVWALASGFDADEGPGGSQPRAFARRYTRDPRIIYRHMPIATPQSETHAVHAARRALFWICRGLNQLPSTPSL